MTKRFIPSGIMPALITPFDKKGNIIEEGFKQVIDLSSGTFTDDEMRLEKRAFFDNSGENFIERGMRYVVIGVDLVDDIELGTTAKLEELTIETKINNEEPDSITLNF